MKTGIGFTHAEIAEMVIEEASRLSGVEPEELEVAFDAWKGQVLASVTRKDGKDLSLPEPVNPPPIKSVEVDYERGRIRIED